MPKYYDSWEPGAFPAQRALCFVLEDTPFALEEPDINPLTIRLASALESTNALDQRIHRASEGLPRLRQEAVALWGGEAVAGEARFLEARIPTPTGEVQTVAAVVLVGDEAASRTHCPPDHQAHAFPAMEAQQLLFQFFSSYCSALDRLALEVDRLFGLGSKRPDWRTVTLWKQGRNRVLNRLRDKDSALSAWLSGFQAKDLEVAFWYLDTLLQLGHIPTKASIDNPSRRWRLWVGPAVDEGPVELATDAVQLCRLLMRDGLTVVNGAYHILYRHYQEHGPPPW